MKDHAPSAERNKAHILKALQGVLPERGLILEVASGTGQHTAFFAPRFPSAVWQPTERRVEMFDSIRAWSSEAELTNVREPLELDVAWAEWPVQEADALLNINMLHITPWATCEALLTGAARVLRPGAPLAYYGAFFREDVETAPSNLEFDRSLKARDPAWGIKQLEEVVAFAEGHGLLLDQVIDMPNNNTLLVLRKPAQSRAPLRCD